jgi:formylglycine-generating enzyme required for sulfatase activity
MIYQSFGQMEKRSPATITRWRALWLKLQDGKGNKQQQKIYSQFQAGFRRCPKDPALDRKSFLMGSASTDSDRYDDEVQREVSVEPFEIQEFPVTNAQYELFYPKGTRGDLSNMDEQAANWITFWDAWCFARWTGNRLPKETEWEYACRAGTTTRYHFGDQIDVTLCRYRESKLQKTTVKGQYPANDWGLFDMHGNVFEWCDTRVAPGQWDRVLRGGSWNASAPLCRAASSYYESPDSGYIVATGFRVVRCSQ